MTRIYTYEQALQKTIYDVELESEISSRQDSESGDIEPPAVGPVQQSAMRKFALRLIGGAPFQSIGTIIVLTCILCYQPVIGGLAFLEKEPMSF